MFSIALAAGAQSENKTDSTGIPSDFPFVFQKLIPGEFQLVKVDMLDDIYLITTGGQLKKLNRNGDLIAVFNEVRKYGNPSYLDVSNPLKLLLYYQNYSTVVILDRLLTQRNAINFRRQNIFSVKAIATSYDNQIWIFDEQDFKLKKIDDEGHVLLESADLRQLKDVAPSPQQIIDSDGLVYLYDPEKGFYIFDYYGAFKNHLPFLHWEDISAGKGTVSGFSENQLHMYTLKSLNLKNYILPSFSKNRIAITSMNNKLFILNPTGLEIYLVK